MQPNRQLRGSAGFFWWMLAWRKTEQESCTFVYMYVYTCVRTYIHTYIRTYIHMYVHTYVRTYPVRRSSSAFSEGSLRQNGESSTLEILIQPQGPNPTSLDSINPWVIHVSIRRMSINGIQWKVKGYGWLWRWPSLSTSVGQKPKVLCSWSLWRALKRHIFNTAWQNTTMSWEVLGNQLLLGELGDQKSYARVAWTVGMAPLK